MAIPPHPGETAFGMQLVTAMSARSSSSPGLATRKLLLGSSLPVPTAPHQLGSSCLCPPLHTGPHGRAGGAE